MGRYRIILGDNQIRDFQDAESEEQAIKQEVERLERYVADLRHRVSFEIYSVTNWVENQRGD